MKRLARDALAGAQVSPHRVRPGGELMQDRRPLGRIILGDEVERVALERAAERADLAEQDYPVLSRGRRGVDRVALVRGVPRQRGEQPQQRERAERRHEEAGGDAAFQQIVSGSARRRRGGAARAVWG
ncbi:hypothetical protein K7957_04175 [Sphingomonas yunnanensis]|uniref:hypothetical protein n=1 Tax=Sphingomonas yunnanensis TaxID=310400 RepID=UPI001CA73A6C|nr:hypothetical protein [Sphingomonas yunnanensis]MBY9062125.1 hypothetical protein [Sphingomonas yunnanensis]